MRAADERERERIDDDVRTLHRLGYAQELLRRMDGFSNFAVSFSIICILAGGVTSFHVGLCSVGGAAIGLGWPLACLFSLAVAATMGQVASAFPTAGGLYHWASILGGRGWGWGTAWFNLLGLVAVLAAINVGTYAFAVSAFGAWIGFDPAAAAPGGRYAMQFGGLAAITASQAAINHVGIRVTSRLTDLSGWLILAVSAALTVSFLTGPSHLDATRLITFTNFSGDAGGGVWPRTDNVAWLFLLGLLLPAYTVSGFDASAHTAEETVGAGTNVPRGIVRSVAVSGIAGWILLSAAVLAAPNLEQAALQKDSAFVWTVRSVLAGPLATVLLTGIAACQYLCGLATVTSASRMAFAFARDGGLPWSATLRQVHAVHRSPVAAIWLVSAAAVLFTVFTPFYDTIAAACAIFLYISYVVPTALGFFAHGRSWTQMGPWHLGRWYRPLAIVATIGCGLLIVIGMQPPNDKNVWIVIGTTLLLGVAWFGWERRRFAGPPQGVMIQQRQSDIAAAEKRLESSAGSDVGHGDAETR
jgi:amino acid transporter